MSRVLDLICKCRDVLADRPEKLRGYVGTGALFDQMVDCAHREIARKSHDHKRELDFSSQDLMELAQDIQGVLKRWEDKMNPKKNIKNLLREVKDGKLSFHNFTEEKTQIMALRRDTIVGLTKTLSVLEFHSVFLYFLEETAQDDIIKYLDRIKL